MLFTRPSKWLTVCLYYNEPWEELLIKAVKPYADVVMQTGVAERFYFLRSWERGPNIRFSFKGNPDVFDTILKPNLEEHFLQYFDSRPSLLLEPAFPASFPDKFKWAPNNSVQYLEHDPMQDRFGSRLGWEICEKQVQASSKLVLETLKQKASRWTYNDMMSCAIKMHLSLANAAGMTLSEATDFFHLLFENWKARSFPDDSISSTHQSGIVIRSFQKIYKAQKDDIVPYQIALWELFKNYPRIEDAGFVNWFCENNNVSIELDIATEIGKLAPMPWPKSGINTKYQSREQLWHYYAEFISLTNNQLGIHNKHEGYLFYVLNQSLLQMGISSVPLKRVAV